MKYILFTTILFFLLSIPLNSQVCELGEINFESQAQVDSFASKYPNCRQFSGTLRINSSTITNVDSFYHVQSLNGSILFYSDELNDISGLKNLKRITGLYFLNGKLTNLDPLENLEVCEFDLVLSSPLLNDVSGLINLRYAAYLWIESPSFISLEWINDIDTVYNYIFSDLNQFEDFEINIENTEKYSITINNWANLQSINFKSNTENINNINFNNINDIPVYNLDKITNLRRLRIERSIKNFSFPNLESCRYLQLTINEFDSLHLPKLEHMESLSISNNPNYKNCSTPYFCKFLREGGNNNISNNNPSCEVVPILTACYEDRKINVLFYFDVNQNLIFDEGEPILPSLTPQIFPNVNSSYLDRNKFLLYFLDNGNYTFSFDTEGEWESSIANQSFSININENYQNDTLFFGVVPTVYKSELNPFISNEIDRCNSKDFLKIYIENSGHYLSNGKLILKLDEKIDSIITIFPSPDSLIGNKVIWNFEDLNPQSLAYFGLQYFTPGPPGFMIGEQNKTTAYILYEDETGSNSSDTTLHKYVIKCSYDPNDKKVSPDRIGGLTKFGEKLQYTIRFQNTGNDVAYDVILRDTLDEFLDLSTLKITNTSHLNSLRTILDGRNISFEFKNIFLPDSTTDLKNSNGFISYSINPYNGLDEMTLIENTASIYFDQNPPIVTNTTQNFLVSTPVSAETIRNDSEIILYPNPSEGLLYFKGNDLEKNAKIKILSLDGKELIEQNLIEHSININKLINGVYFIQIIQNNKTTIRKIILSR